VLREARFEGHAGRETGTLETRAGDVQADRLAVDLARFVARRGARPSRETIARRAAGPSSHDLAVDSTRLPWLGEQAVPFRTAGDLHARTLARIAFPILSRVGAHAEIVEQLVATREPGAAREPREARVPEAASLAVTTFSRVRALREESRLGVRVPAREVAQEGLAPEELACEVVGVADCEPVEGARLALLAEQVEARDGAALVAARA
jgi:hypothetical protein